MSRAISLVATSVWRGWAAATLAAVAAAACSVNTPSLPSSEVTGAVGSSERPETKTQAGGPRTATPGKAKVALLLPLSGPGNLAVVAKAMKQAGEMAVFERPSSDFELFVKDDRGTPEGAKLAAEEALREGAELILGPLLSSSVEAVAPVAAAARVQMIAFSNDRRVLRPGTYLLSFMPDQDVERIVRYSLAQGKRNYAALVPDDAYGRIVEEAFTRAVGGAQGNVVAIERYGRGGSSGLLEATRRLGETINNPTMDGVTTTVDALLIPGEPEALQSIGPLIAYARIDPSKVKLLGTGGWDSSSLGRDVTFVGGWFPAPDQRGWQAFSEKFSKTYSATPPRIASIAYDGVGVAMALSGAPAIARFTAEGIARPSGFQGADGTFRFHSDGTAHRALAVHEVQSVGSRVIEAAEGTGAPAAQSRAPAAGRPTQVN